MNILSSFACGMGITAGYTSLITGQGIKIFSLQWTSILFFIILAWYGIWQDSVAGER